MRTNNRSPIVIGEKRWTVDLMIRSIGIVAVLKKQLTDKEDDVNLCGTMVVYTSSLF